jgi:hypothetical protein
MERTNTQGYICTCSTCTGAQRKSRIPVDQLNYTGMDSGETRGAS